MRLIIHTAAIILLLTVLSLATMGETLDDRQEVVSLYAKGKRLLRDGSYLEASRTFEELAGRFPDSKNLDLVLFNKAKADYYFGDYDKAAAGLGNFMARYPRSAYYPHAVFFRGNVNYSRGFTTRALRDYVEAYRVADSKALDDIISSSIVAAVVGASSVSLGSADFQSVPSPKRCVLIRRVAEALSQRGDYSTANQLLSGCGDAIAVPANAAGAGELEVAVVLPLSGELQSYGEDIYNGAVIAAEFYRQETGGKIRLEAFDTKGDPINAGRIVRELGSLSYDVVLGPLTSEEAAVASATLSCSNLPLVAPAATQAGLTLISESSFQLSPNIELEGVQMAEYAMASLGADSAAIITPTGTDELRMAGAFSERFKQLGGTIVAIEYYRTRDRDFGVYINDIKASLLGAHPDSVYFINEDGDTLDADGVPAYIDCLFLPGRPEQLRLLLPQINFYNLSAAYLGSDGWGDEAVVKLGDNITKSAVFPSAFLQQGSSDQYLKFAVAYDSRYGTQPQRLASLGYDGVSLIAAAARKAGATRDQLVDQLKLVADYQGAAGRVTFGAHRENTAMPIYRLENQQAVYLGVGVAETAVETETTTEPETSSEPKEATQQ